MLSYNLQVLAQKGDSTFNFKGAVSVTNNGFSIIPVFSLGKPATMLDFTMGNKRLSFDPQFRFSLEGKPWIFNLTYHYKLVSTRKYQVTVGGYLPALNFVERTFDTNGTTQKFQTVRRFISGELILNYVVKKNITVGLYYLRGHGLQADGPGDTHYLAIRSSFNKVRIKGRAYVDINPQLFYLKVDTQDGFYANVTATLGLKNFPLSFSAIVNKAIQTEIPSKQFDWNMSLLYTIDRHYILKNSAAK
jgi:hypothetical protein